MVVVCGQHVFIAFTRYEAAVATSLVMSDTAKPVEW